MDNFLINILICCTLVLHHVVWVQPCSCLAPDPFEHVCGSDFAINATVLSEEITYPEGSDKTNPNTIYAVRYQLDIHNVFNPSSDDVDSIPSVLSSYGPGSICGLSLGVGETYILTGIIDHSDSSGEAVLDMSLCNYHLNVNEQLGLSHENAEQIMDAIDCSNPPDESYMHLLYGIDKGLIAKKSSVPAVKTPKQDTAQFWI